MSRLLPLLLCALTAPFFSAALHAEEAVFYRAINLGGPAVTIDGRTWEGNDAPNLTAAGGSFENQKVALKPPVDSARTQMIRSSRWGNKVEVSLTSAPAGVYQVFLYIWEDNHSEQFRLFLNDKELDTFHSGAAGSWKRLGPWKCESVNGRIKVAAQGGAANLSGLEVWAGEGMTPEPGGPEFASMPTDEQIAFFESKIRPVLVERCYECHSAKAEKIKGGLVLDSRAGLIKGGDIGPAITPGDPEASLLIEAIRHQDKDLAMPPKKKLPPEEIAALEEWVKMGAPDPRTEDTVAVVQKKETIDWEEGRQWWSLRPLTSPEPPAVKDGAWPANEIDRFILAKIEEAGLQPAADAEKRTLIRRATYDLIGLPPTPEEVNAFLADDSADAFAKIVDRLLASPHYGERWGRYWLDVVRYADTAGDNSDFPVPQIHRYRDWVIAAMNRDMPYDEFVRAQLAGDLLPGASEEEKREKLIATGYIANSRRFGSRVDDYPQHLTIEDTIDNFGRTFLGMSINCARCHDHKFDPISAEDYYAIYGIFHSTRYPWPGIELDQRQRDFVPLAEPEIAAAFEKEKAEKQKPLDAEVKRLEKEVKEAKDDGKKPLEEQLKKAKEEAQNHSRMPPPYDLAYAVAEGKKREDVALHQRGDPAKLGPVVPRRFLTVLGGKQLPQEDKSSGRLALAEWLLESANPLPPRVMVNRVWLHHFGSGIVPTPNEFGKQGKPPTHPELLDWLASRFVAEGWSLKKIHRLIMLSRTYRLASARSEEAVEKDPANQLLVSYPRRRLDAEAIRDTLLALGGDLDRTPGGAHPFPPLKDFKFTQHNPFKAIYETNKRSIYLMTQRIQRHPYLAVFDGADPSTSTPLRTASTTPLQALFLLNDKLVHEQSQRFADRLVKESGDDAARLHLAYEMAFARTPEPDEISQAERFLDSVRGKLRETDTPADKLDAGAWQALVRVLFRLNEFVYLD